MNTLLVSMSCLSSNIIDWLFEALTKPLFALITVFEGIFKGLAGIVDPASADIGLVDGAAADNNIVVQLFQSKVMQNIMSSLLLFGIVVLVLSVILAIIRNIYKEDSKVTISSIIGQAIKAVIGFILVPALCLIGVMISNVILVAIDGATNAAGTASFAAGIYQACQRENPVPNIFNMVIESSPVNYFGNIDSGTGGTESPSTDDTEADDFHLAGIIYAQYLWQSLTEDCMYSPDGWIYRQANQVYPSNPEYIDILGLKVPDDELLDFSDMNGWNNGNGKEGVIDTKEDVEAFYEMLKSQYLQNFPHAPKQNIGWFFGDRYSYVPCSISFVRKAGFFTNVYFGAGADPGENKESSFVYYYYGQPLFDWGNEDARDEKYLKQAQKTFKDNDTFGAASWTIKKESSQWTNDNLNKTLCMGDDINYFYAFITSIMIAKSLFFLCFGMAKRIVQLAVYYVLSPIALALYPFDNGAAFAKWKSDFIGYTIGAFGAVAGVNLTIQLMPVITRVKIFNTTIYNDVTRLILYIILAQGMEALVKTLSGWIGAKDLLSEGKETSKKATEPIKKVAGTAMKVAGTAVGVATGIGLAKAGSKAAAATRANFKSLSAEKQAEEAQKAGYSSVGEYEAALDKEVQSGTFRGQFKSAGGKMLTGATNKMMSTTFGQAFDKYSGFSGVMVQNAKNEAKNKTKTDLETKFQTDFKAGLVTADLGNNMQSKLKALEDAFTLASSEIITAARKNGAEINKSWAQLKASGIDDRKAANVKNFLLTGDASALSGLSNKQQQLVRAQREEYLRSHGVCFSTSQCD